MRKDLKLVGVLSVGLALGLVDNANATDADAIWGTSAGGAATSSYGNFYNAATTTQQTRNNYNVFKVRQARRLQRRQARQQARRLIRQQIRQADRRGWSIPDAVLVGDFFNRPILIGGSGSSGGTISSSGGGSVPVPASPFLLLSGLIGLLAFRRKS